MTPSAIEPARRQSPVEPAAPPSLDAPPPSLDAPPPSLPLEFDSEPSPWIEQGGPRGDGHSSLEIHIDKIEVRTPPPPREQPAPPPFKPRLSLDEYLRQRRAGLR